MNKMNNAPQIVGRVVLPAAQEPLLPAQQVGNKQSDESDRVVNLSWVVTFVSARKLPSVVRF